MKSLLASLLASLLIVAPGFAQERDVPGFVSNVPGIVSKGFDTYRRDGALAAVNVWFTGSVRENDDSSQDDAVSRLDRVQGVLGRVYGFEPVRTVTLSRSTRRVYVAVKFEKGVAWMSFDCYLPDKEWIITRFDFNTNANIVLPPNILGGQ